MLSEDDGTLKPHFQGQEIDLPRLIINQFRWLDRIVDGKVSGYYSKMGNSQLMKRIVVCSPWFGDGWR